MLLKVRRHQLLLPKLKTEVALIQLGVDRSVRPEEKERMEVKTMEIVTEEGGINICLGRIYGLGVIKEKD
jgi:hypothetical protein